MNEFKQCSNGHYYQGETCPYCASRKSDTDGRTAMYGGGGGDAGGDTSSPTVATNGTINDDMNETIVQPYATGSSRPKHTGTIFGDDVDMDTDIKTESGKAQAGSARYSRKLVGWLVSYSLDELGVDYRLYEGRNIIGRNDECSITVDDGKVSGEHAILLFRADKYSITDRQSSHGTFVNGEDIDLEPRYLKDGDKIRIGNTTFLFRTSLF